MSTLTINLPDSVEVEKSDVLRMLAARLYERGTLSLGQAADLAGMAKWEFAEILLDYGVFVFNYPASDLAEDLNNA
jgi:predicted HTH domain antitoxin